MDPSPTQNTPRRRLAAPIAAVIVLLAAVVAASGPDLKPKNFGVVEAGKVYRSGQLTPAAFERVVREHHLRTVIDLGSYEPGTRGERRNALAAAAMGVTRYVFDLEGDGTGNPNAYVQAIAIMRDPARQPVLVHCGAGAERTSIACMLYSEMRGAATIEDGFADAERHRHRDRKNPHLREVVSRWGAAIERAVREGRQISDPAAPPLPPPAPAPVVGG
jgi:protein tyrosine/serine phosphatase